MFILGWGIFLNKTRVCSQVKISRNEQTTLISSSENNIWSTPITLEVGNQPTCVSLGDVNNDGKDDIVTANQGDDTISILLWNSNFSSWDSQITKAVGNSPESVYIGDANNDGQNEIVTSSLDNTVSIFKWNDTSEDWDRVIKIVGDDPESVIIEDANNDGFNDIVTANMGEFDVSIILWNNVTKDWNDHIRRDVGYLPYSVFVDDANNDGHNDIVTANFGIDYNISILLWNDTSKDWDEKITKIAGGYPYSIFIEDANNDGQNDIIVSSLDDKVFIFCWNTTSHNWDNPINRTVGSQPLNLFVGDANNDGYNDIATANFFGHDTSLILWNESSSDWGSEISLSVGQQPHYVIIGDANDDESNDIITANYEDNSVSILLVNFEMLDAPYLESILPAQDYDGIIELNWTDVDGAVNYIVYRDTKYISSTNILTPIAIVNESNYTDTITINQNYFYAIIAQNLTAISPISNCQNVAVQIPLETPILYPIYPNVSSNGNIFLNWNEILGAHLYYVYRDDANITNLENASLIAQTIENFYTDSILEDGIYYYVIVAGDLSSNSSISNCIVVIVEIQLDISISGYYYLNNLIFFMIIILLFVVKVKNKSKFKN
jgi:hypothetical protein